MSSGVGARHEDCPPGRNSLRSSKKNRQTNPISRAEAERQTARFSPNEANFALGGRTTNRGILAERSQFPRRGPRTQGSVGMDFASRRVLQTAAPNEPNLGLARERFGVRGSFWRAHPGTADLPIGIRANGCWREEPIGRSAVPGMYRTEPKDRRIRPNEPNFRAGIQHHKALCYKGLRPKTSFHRPRRTNPIRDRSEAGRHSREFSSVVSARRPRVGSIPGRPASQAVHSRRICPKIPPVGRPANLVVGRAGRRARLAGDRPLAAY